MRQTSIKILYNNKNISKALAPYLLAFSYTDNSSGEADDIQLTLENTQHLWEGDWLPEKGDSIEAAVVARGFRFDSNGQELIEQLYCGYYEVDEININTPPSTITIKAISTCDSTSLRSEENTKAWESVHLKAIAEDIAQRAEMDLKYLAKHLPFYLRRDQSKQSDLAFLEELCSRDALSLKVTCDSLIIFDEQQQEQGQAVAVFDMGVADVLRYSFKSKTRDVYRACLVQYTDTRTNETTKCLFEPPNPVLTGQLLKINEKVESLADAERLARARLRAKNVKENTASLEVVGDTRLVAGTVIEIGHVGKFSGRYYINKATHSYGNAGYTIALELWKAGGDYTLKRLEYDEHAYKQPRVRKGKKSMDREWVGSI